MTEHRLDPEDREELLRDHHPAKRFAPIGKDQKIKSPTVQRWRLDCVNRFPPFQPLADGTSLLERLTIDSRRRDENEPVRFGVGRRRKQNPLNEAEHGRRRSDPKPEREHRHGGEAGVLQQLPASVAKVIHDFAGANASTFWKMTKLE